MFFKISVLTNFIIFTGKLEFPFNKVARLRPAALLKRNLNKGVCNFTKKRLVFPVNIAKFFKNSLFFKSISSGCFCRISLQSFS